MLEVETPREINEYTEKIIFGLSVRQITGAMAAAILGTGSYFLCTKNFGLTEDIASYIVIFLTAPPLTLGFVKIKGMYFEDYAKLFYEYRSTIGRKVKIDEYQPAFKPEPPAKEETHKRKKKRKGEDLSEVVYKYPSFSKKADRKAWKNAKRYIEES